MKHNSTKTKKSDAVKELLKNKTNRDATIVSIEKHDNVIEGDGGGYNGDGEWKKKKKIRIFDHQGT